ncbi:MAG TPA: serine/threonine-protein kinase [Polyangiaceae bacterium]
MSFVGQTIAHFRIVAKLGQGGMGAVYEAFDEKLRRTVALKLLLRDATDDEAKRKRFLREARSAAAVTHPNIATIHEVGEVDGQIYIAMELVEGRSLRRVLADGALQPKDAVRIAQDVARGLAKAHDKGIVHRDLKPDNIMVSSDRHVKVLDFGVAKSSRAPEATLPAGTVPAVVDTDVTHEGQLVGTPAYMSPEQVTGRAVDQRADIFSLGVVIYEMVTGTRPFQSASGTALLVAMTTETPEPPSKRNPLVPAELEAVIARCMSKKPDDRYPSARELLGALERLDAAQSSQASLPTLDAQTTSGVAPSQPVTARRSRVAIVGIVLAACVGTLGIWRLASKPAAPTSVASSSSSAPAAAPSAPTALTDLPPPKSSNPQAVAAYRVGLQAFRDGNFEAFDAAIRDAIRLDPAFAAGELRMAFVLFHSVRGAVTDARAHLQKASRLRADLSDRDRAFLDLLEPVINREPPDSDELERRLRAAIDRWPKDAELLYLLANEQRRYDVDASLATYERVLALDPSFMTAWRQKAQTQEMRGDVGGARASLEECLRRMPDATGCRNERIWLDQDEGRCEAIETDARQMIAADPESFRAYEALAHAGVALRRPREAIEEILKQTWRRAPAEVRARDQVVTDARRAALEGRFGDARDLGRAYQKAIDADPSAAVHASAAHFLVELALETGDVPGAARIAQDFIKRQGAWSGAPDGETGRMLHVERLAGLIDDAELRRSRAAFLEDFVRQSSRVRFVRGVAWLDAYAATADTQQDAEEALRELAAWGPVPVGLRTSFNDEALGRTDLLAGRIDDATAHLARAAHMCDALDDPFRHVHAQLQLGSALEGKGDTAGACAAYGEVLAWWGSAKPRSTSAEQAKERRARLACR